MPGKRRIGIFRFPFGGSRRGTPRKPGRRNPYPAQWPQVARAILAERPVCEDCQTRPAKDVHHLDRVPSNLDPTNLIAVCTRCHLRRHTRGPQRAEAFAPPSSGRRPEPRRRH